MKTFIFIRHAQSTANAGAAALPQAEIPLSELGVQQAFALAPHLPPQPAMVLTSDFLRTKQTSQPYCELVGAPAKANGLLNEFSAVDVALIAGMDAQQRKPIMVEYWNEPSLTKRMGQQADTFAEFVHRVSAFKLAMHTLPDNTVIFGHGIWLALLVWQCLGFSCSDDKSMHAFRQFQLGLPMSNCAVYRFFETAIGGWQVQASN